MGTSGSGTAPSVLAELEDRLQVLRRPAPLIMHRSERRVSRMFTVESQHLRFANGREADYERIRSRRGAVLCVPFDGRHFILSVEYAAGIGRHALTLVKGRIDPGEEGVAAARRELQEEIGLDAGRLELLREELTVAPGTLELRMHVYLCTELMPRSLPGDEPEPPVPVQVTPQQALELVFSPSSVLQEGRCIAALTLALHRLGYLRAGAGG